MNSHINLGPWIGKYVYFIHIDNFKLYSLNLALFRQITKPYIYINAWHVLFCFGEFTQYRNKLCPRYVMYYLTLLSPFRLNVQSRQLWLCFDCDWTKYDYTYYTWNKIRFLRVRISYSLTLQLSVLSRFGMCSNNNIAVIAKNGTCYVLTAE